MKGSTVWVLVYVDDILVMGMCSTAVDTVRSGLKAKFEMTDHGPVTSFLGVEFFYTENGASLRQKHFINILLHRFNMFCCKHVGSPFPPSASGAGRVEGVVKRFDQNIYQQAIGALLYISNRTRTNISAAVSFMARKSNAPTVEDWSKVKRILRYLKGTSDLGLNFAWNAKLAKPVVLGYSDADCAGDLIDRMSTSGTIIFINEIPTVWKSQKQTRIALSYCESEYISIS